MRENGTTLAALVSAMLNIINEVTASQDFSHTVIGIILAIATLFAIWRIDVRRNNRRHNDHGR